MGLSQTPQALVPAEFTSGGMTLLSTTTMSGSSVTLSSIPQTYNLLHLVIRNFLPASNSVTLLMRFNGDSNSNRHRGMLNTGTSYETQTSFNNTTVVLDSFSSNSASTNLTEVRIPNYANTTTWKMADIVTVSSPNTNFVLRNATGLYNQTSAITSLDFLPDSGNFTSGTILLYGVK